MIIEAITFIGAPVVRSVAGWAEKSFEDGKIQRYEWKKLIETSIRLTIIQSALYFSAQGYVQVAGIETQVPILATAAAAFLVDKLFNSLKQNQNVKPKVR